MLELIMITTDNTESSWPFITYTSNNSTPITTKDYEGMNLNASNMLEEVIETKVEEIKASLSKLSIDALYFIANQMLTTLKIKSVLYHSRTWDELTYKPEEPSIEEEHKDRFIEELSLHYVNKEMKRALSNLVQNPVETHNPWFPFLR